MKTGANETFSRVLIDKALEFTQLGGIAALSRLEGREEVFEALRQSALVHQSLLAATLS